MNDPRLQPEPERRDAIVEPAPIHTTATAMPEDDEAGPGVDPQTIPDPGTTPVVEYAEAPDAGREA